MPELPRTDLVFLRPRVSPRGDRVAVTFGGGEVLLVDRSRRQQRLKTPAATHGLAWDPSGDALWISAGQTAANGLWRLSLDGTLAQAYRGVGVLFLHDLSGDRRMLVHHGHEHQGVRVKASGETQEHDIATTGGDAGSIDLSVDGTQLLTREGARFPQATCTRRGAGRAHAS